MGFRMDILQFDKNNRVEDFTFVLSTRAMKHLGKIANIKPDSVRYKKNMNGANEISFEIYKNVNGEIDPLWKKITDFKLVYIVEMHEYYQIQVSHDDKLDAVKTITGFSLCEAELSQTNLYDIEINTESDIERENYVVTTFYNKHNPKGSLLHRILKSVPHYTIKHVDESLYKLQRSFSVNGTSVYEFLTGECSEQFNCLFIFDSSNRSISVYDLYTTCNECGYRGDYSDTCPKCGGHELKYFGEDTTILINKENLTDSVKLETNVDAVKNCFKLTAGDDIMTATVVSLNQNGSQFIYNITSEQKEDMSPELVEKIESYDVLYNSYTEEYQQLLEDYYDVIDEVLYYESEMMPESGADDNEENDNSTETIAQKEAKKLTISNLSPISLTSVTTGTSKTTVESALKNYARVFVDTSLVKLDFKESSFSYSGIDSDGYSYGNWTGIFKVVSYSDEEDIAYSNRLTIKVYDNYIDFIDQKIKKQVLNYSDENGSVFDVLNIDDISDFKRTLKLYGLNRLSSFYDAIQTALDVLVEADQSSPEADLYEDFYLNYYNKLQACQNEIDERKATITSLEETKNDILSRITQIQNALNFEDYLGDTLYLEFSAYRRDGEYNNSNYISDGLSNTEIIERARDFLEAAKKELIKSSTYQHTISTTLDNILLMEEFKEIVNKFALGNFIRSQVDDDIYRLRLISYEITFSDIQKISIDFSDMTKTANGYNDIQSILSSAVSMSSSYAYVSKQAEKGDSANNTLVDFVKSGLNSAHIAIKNNNQEEVTYGKFGILCKAWDDIMGDYSPEQFRITHNLLCFTNDNWKSTISALGKHDYYKYVDDLLVKDIGYGLTAQFVTAGYINGSQIIGGEIYSQNYSSTTGSYFNLNDGNFTFAGGKLKYDSTKDNINLTGTITFEGIDYSDEESKYYVKDSLGIIDAEKNVEKALSLLSDISSDNKITPVEKLQLQDRYNAIKSSHEKILEKYKNINYITDSDFINYRTAYSDISNMFDDILDDIDSTYILSQSTENIYNSKPTYISCSACDGRHLNNYESSEFVEYKLTLSSDCVVIFDGDVVGTDSNVDLSGVWKIYDSDENLLAEYKAKDYDLSTTSITYNATKGDYIIRMYANIEDLGGHDEITIDDKKAYIELWLYVEYDNYIREQYNNIINTYYSTYQQFTNKVITKLETNIESARTLADEAKLYGAELAKCLGFTTEISSDYIISPYIGGGYLKITDDNTGSVVIDPKGINKDYTGYIFGVYNASNNLVMGVDTDGNGIFEGKLITTEGLIANWKIDETSISSGIESDGTYEVIPTEVIDCELVDVGAFGVDHIVEEELGNVIEVDIDMEANGVIAMSGELTANNNEEAVKKVFRLYDSNGTTIFEEIVDLSDKSTNYITVQKGTYKAVFTSIITYAKKEGIDIYLKFTASFSRKYTNPSSINLYSIESTKNRWISTSYNGTETFWLTKQGLLHAKNAEIEGNVKSGSTSNYTEMRSGEINIFKYGKKTNTFNQSGNHFYSDGTYIGKIGTNIMASDSLKKGLVFDLEKDAAYTTWASRNDTSSSYNMKWTYCSKQCGNYKADTLHAGCDIDMHGNTLKNVSFENGGISGTIKFKQIITLKDDGTPATWANASLTFTNGILTDGTWHKE